MSCFFCNRGNPTWVGECSHCLALIPTCPKRELIRLTRDSIADTSSIYYQPLVQLWIHEDNKDQSGESTIGEFRVHGVEVLLIIDDSGKVNVSTSNASELNIAADRSGRARPTTVTVLGAKAA
jgi:hypothetical protein